ncbi:MBL fold metallo-hydrolase [Devosia pacifica]|uniref:MBL fold metallo-hydrolase n=1 Tax=Devosia pacifica TaxID=1335967 RepID=A0A918SB05_9HYPH|nr:MBL fold metallo-hydrolase [Devosia pacifica]GHA29752.1 MBL fold metallo-hydrolase [Devosia pacifica]
MSAAPSQPSFDRDFAPPHEQPVELHPLITRITAGNSGPFTFTGTNSFLVGKERVAIIDPGPDLPQHRDALISAVAGRTVTAVIVTHTHRDHSALARVIAEAVGAPLWFGGRHKLSRPLQPAETDVLEDAADVDLVPDRQLQDDERFVIDEDTALRAIATPGHCHNHICLGLERTDILFSGDHVMGWNSTLVAVPDGSMRDYLASLQRLISMDYRYYLPAHGGAIADGPVHARALLAHRLDRNRQVINAVAAGADSIDAVVRGLYPDLDGDLARAARMIVTAHAEYLGEEGLIFTTRRGDELSLKPGQSDEAYSQPRE